MIAIRRSTERGHFDHGWLNTYHTFSFADYDDPRYRGFRTLRVINEDRVQPGKGFGTHPHRDMEIITYVLQGALQHEDSMGNGTIIRPGEVQRMTAGTGVQHSEFNPSTTEPVHLMQIWIRPNQKGLPPSYEQKEFPEQEKIARLRLIASHNARERSVTIHQDAELYSTILSAGQAVTHHLHPNRHAWVQVLEGQLTINGQTFNTGDGAAMTDEAAITIRGLNRSEALLFDLA